MSSTTKSDKGKRVDVHFTFASMRLTFVTVQVRPADTAAPGAAAAAAAPAGPDLGPASGSDGPADAPSGPSGDAPIDVAEVACLRWCLFAREFA